MKTEFLNFRISSTDRSEPNEVNSKRLYTPTATKTLIAKPKEPGVTREPAKNRC